MSKQIVNPFITVRNVTKEYNLGYTKLKVLHGVDLEIYRGEFIILMGPSGSGKTTLLNLIGGIDRVTTGQVIYQLQDGRPVDITTLNDPKLTKFRRNNLAYVFQFYSLLPTLTASENIQLMTELVNIKGKELRKRAEHWLETVGLKDRKDNFPSQLSGGEIQRVAIARAISKKPNLLLCDEPTGQLDVKSSKNVVETLHRVCKSNEITIIMVTHDESYKYLADRVLYIEDGNIIKTEANLEINQ